MYSRVLNPSHHTTVVTMIIGRNEKGIKEIFKEEKEGDAGIREKKKQEINTGDTEGLLYPGEQKL